MVTSNTGVTAVGSKVNTDTWARSNTVSELVGQIRTRMHINPVKKKKREVVKEVCEIAMQEEEEERRKEKKKIY